MNGPELSAAVKARLVAEIPSRPVFVGAPPDGTAPARYLVVRASEGSEESTRSSQTVSVQTPALWVTSVSRNAKPNEAESEANWAAAKARAALRNWRPESEWAVRSDASAMARRDESLPDTTFYAVEQFSFRSHI